MTQDAMREIFEDKVILQGALNIHNSKRGYQEAGPLAMDEFMAKKDEPSCNGIGNEWSIAVRYSREAMQAAHQSREAEVTKLREALEKAVRDYGKPGGPWNVPGEPGTWIEMARQALTPAKDSDNGK